MNANEQLPSSEPSLRGTPQDYSTDMYRVYFEVGEHEGHARQAIEDFLGPERAKMLVVLPYGYECELAIQVVPDIVRELAKRNIGVYQVIRYAKTKNVWT
jgi:hypothetical protein